MSTQHELEELSDETLATTNGGTTYPATEYDFVAVSYTDGCNHCVCTESASDTGTANTGLPNNWVARRKQP